MLRFAPSPTGYLHIGNARVATLNYIYSQNTNKDFFLRIDDTDKERSSEKYTEAIIEDLSWLGIKFSKIVKQSERELKEIKMKLSAIENNYNKLNSIHVD